MTKHIQWDGQLSQEGFDILKGEGGCIVCPTKVGYIIMTSDKAGLERKFEANERNRNKPGVVLCGSMDELRALAQLNPEIEAFLQKVSSQQATIVDLTPNVLTWLKEKKLTSKLKVRF